MTLLQDALLVSDITYTPDKKINSKERLQLIDDIFVFIKEFASKKDVSLINLQTYGLEPYNFYDDFLNANLLEKHQFQLFDTYATIFNYAMPHVYFSLHWNIEFSHFR